MFMTVASEWAAAIPRSLWKVAAVNWGIAFFDYCFQVPA